MTGALLAVLAGAAPAQTILHEWRGRSQLQPTGDGFGTSFAALGDVDRDGVPDIAIGARTTNVGQLTRAGAAYVFSGRTKALVYSYQGAVAGTLYGRTLVGPGDIDQDGHADFMIGLIGSSPLLWLHSGKDGSVLRAISTHVTVAGPGDVDGDGVPDLFLGNESAVLEGMTGVGLADLVSGATWEKIYTFTGTFEEQYFGVPARAGDVDADGVADLMVAAPGLWTFTGTSGAWVYSGASGEVAFRLRPTSGSFPWAFDAAGDIDGDGFDDVAVTDIGDRVSPQYYRVLIYGGPDGRLLATFESPDPTNPWLGDTVAAAGDVDGDGHDDVLTGYVRGTQQSTFLFSGRDGSVLFSLTGGFAVTGGGGNVCGPGDIDGDDFPDFLVGGFWDAATSSSTARLYAGAPPGVATLGVGCAGATGVVPRIGMTRAAAPGRRIDLNLSRTRGGAPAVLILGASSTSWAGQPLPIDLALLSLPGCLLRVSPDFVLPAATIGPAAKGRASLSLVIPDVPALTGQRLYAQWLVLGADGSATRALDVTIQ